MLWTCSIEVMADMWRARFDNEWVDSARLPHSSKDPNDWPYVARLLCAAGRLQVHAASLSDLISYRLLE